jgi:Zn-dependent peptidase ImmA (M78 family)
MLFSPNQQVQEREANLFAAQLLVAESLIKPGIKTLYPVFESFETRSNKA